jgi:hypothetical protein
MLLLKLCFIRNPVLVNYSICMRQGSSDLSGSHSALSCLCLCARAQLGLRDFHTKESMNTFDDVWLSRYPRPEYIGFDNVGEYKNVFEELVNNYGIKKKNSTSFNPQYNGIIERVNLTLND